MAKAGHVQHWKHGWIPLDGSVTAPRHPTLALSTSTERPAAADKKALLRYVDDWSSSLNRALRSGKLSEADKAHVRQLDALVAASPPLPRTTAYRGVDGSWLPSSHLAPGARIPNTGFLSVSRDAGTAHTFAMDEAEQPTIFQIDIPHGTPAVDVSKVLADEGGDFEGELLLARDHVLTVVQDVQLGGVRHISATLGGK